MQQQQLPPWIDDTGKRFTNEEVFQKLLNAINNGENYHQIMIGTDSNANGRQYKFVTVLCIWNVGHGADYYYLANYEPRATYRGNGHKMRLFNESVKSVEVADSIRDTLGFTVHEIHADISGESQGEFSSEIAKQVRGYITASGYRAVLKGETLGPFVASCVADRHSK